MDWFTGSQGRKDDTPGACRSRRMSSLSDKPAGGATRAWWQQQVRQQLGRGFLWAPVGVAGLIGYYGLPAEPPVAAAIVIAGGVALICMLALPAGPTALVQLVAGFVLAGFLWGKVSTWLNPVTILPGSTGKMTISGWVEDIATHTPAGRASSCRWTRMTGVVLIIRRSGFA
jgi:hypothetical protein